MARPHLQKARRRLPEGVVMSLKRWFKEEWVDIKTGKPCGRQKGEKRKGYPACRPSKRVSKDTPKTAGELGKKGRESFKRRKKG